MSNVIELFNTKATTTKAVDYAQEKQGTTHWNVPEAKEEEIGKTLLEQLENKGVFYHVDKRDNLTTDNHGHLVPTGKVTIFNDSLNAPLSVMTDSYHICQNRDIFAPLMAALDDANLNLETAFTRVTMEKDGTRVRAEIIFPETSFDVKVGDTVALCVTATNSFDGSGAFSLQMGAYRFICANGMVSANGILGYRCAHNANLNPRNAATIIAKGMQQYQDDKESLMLQATTRATTQTAYDALCIINDIDKAIAPTFEAYMTEIRPTKKRTTPLEAQMKLWDKYRYELGATQWAVNNMLTHISTHGNKEQYSSSVKIATRNTKEKLVQKALANMLAA